MKSISISSHTPTPAMCLAILAAVGILLERCAKAIIFALRSLCTWLQAEHNFTPFEADEAERVYLPGWQYLIYSAAAVVVCVILSIQF